MLKAIVLGALLCAGTSHAQLVGRDLDPTTPGFEAAAEGDFLWYAFPNASGPVNWYQAQAFVQGLDVGGVTGWRMAEVGEIHSMYDVWARDMRQHNPPVGAPTYQSALGVGSPLFHFGAGPGNYWASDISIGVFPDAFATMAGWGGWQGNEFDTLTVRTQTLASVWAVHDALTSPVPEPETYLLMLVGLAALTLRRRAQGRPRL